MKRSALAGIIGLLAPVANGNLISNDELTTTSTYLRQPTPEGAENLLPGFTFKQVVPASSSVKPSAISSNDLQMQRSNFSEDALSMVSGTKNDALLDNQSTPAEPTLLQSQYKTELVIIDKDVADSKVLEYALKPGYEIVRLNGDESGIDQIVNILAQYQKLQGIHIVSHGEQGAILLGGERIDAQILKRNPRFANALQQASVEGADLSLYGCDVASGEAGEQFIDLLATETQMDIAASNNTTGNLAKGGDWQLEIVKGNIDSTSPFNPEALADFSEILPVADSTLTFASGWTDNNSTLNHNDFVLSGSCDTGGALTWNIAAGEAYPSNNGTANEVCTITVAADGTNTDTFELTGISIREYGANDNWTDVKVTAVRASDSADIDSNNSVDSNNSSADTFTESDFDFSTFSGVALASFKVVFTIGGGNSGDFAFTSFTVQNATAPSSDTAPTLTATGANPTYTEGGSSATLFTSAAFSDEDGNTQNATAFTLTVTNVSDTTETLNIDGSAIALTNGNSGTTSDSSFSYSVAVSSGTATVTLTSGSVADATFEGIINAISYENSADSPSTGSSRVVTITSITDAGSSNNNSSISVASTVTVSAVTSDTTTGSFDTTAGTGLTNSLVFDSSDESLTIASASHIDSSAVANGQGGTDTLIIAASVSADLTTSGFSLSNFENLTLNDGATATLTEAQHDTFSANAITGGAATESIILNTPGGTTSGVVTGDADIESYTLNGAFTYTLPSGATTQNVTGSDADSQTINIGSLDLVAGANLDGGAGQTDTLQMADGSSINNATTITGFETLDVTGSVTMTEAQHDGFTSGVTASGGSDQITISAADGDGAISADADVETYVLGAAMTIVHGAASQDITGSSSDDTVSTAFTVTGTLDAGGGTDTLSLGDGADVDSATISNFENLTLANDATVTVNATQLLQFTGTITAGGSETINVNNDGDLATLATTAIENYVVGDDSTNTRTITLGSGHTSGTISATTANDAVTFNIGTQSFAGTLTGEGTTNDTVQMGNGSSIASATLNNVENLTVDASASVTMTEDQHDVFSNITATGTNQITISAASNGFTGDSAIETYVLGAANSIVLGAAGQNVTGSTGNDSVDISTLTLTASTINAGDGTDTMVMADGANISASGTSNFENLTLASGASVTMTFQQMSDFNGGTIVAPGTGGSGETITVTNNGNFSTLNNSAIENYIVNDDATNSRTITLGTNDTSTNVSATATTDAITFTVPGITYTGTLTGQTTTADTLQLANSADISGATVASITNLILADNAEVSMTPSQFSLLSTTVTANGAGVNGETINITGDGDLTVNATVVETYVIADDSTDTRTVTIQSDNSNTFTASSTSDAITLDIGATDFSGSFTANADVANTLVVDGTADVASATLSGFTNLTLDGATNNVTLTVAQLNALSGTVTGSGTDTLTLNATGTVTGGNLSAIETFATGTGGSITITIPAADVSGKTLTATTSASDSFTVTGSTGSQTINGSAGGDNLSGGDGADIINGNAGNDTLNGGTGADTLSPGAGTDSITGSDGNDTFSGSSSDLNGDTIVDLTAGDVIKLTGVTSLSTSNVRFNNSSTIQIDTDATTFSSVEVTLTLSNSAGDNLNILAVNDNSGDTDITFENANDVPVFSGLDNTPTFTENGSAVVLDDNVTISDTELDALNGTAGNYSGATLTIARNGGANADDVFAESGNLSALTAAGNLTFNSLVYGTVTTNSGGTLVLTFSDSSNIPTTAIVNSIVQAITYSNSSDAPDASVTLDWTFNDGTANSTGTNQVAVSVTAVNDAPVLDSGQSPTLTAINEDVADGDNTGTDIATMVVDSSITDADGSAVEALAVVTVDNTNGVWQYSTNNGTAWENFSETTGQSVDIASSARLLDGTLTGASTHKIRFVPSQNYNGSATITFRAWDKTSGTAGATADTASNGGTTAFSSVDDSASITVNAVNDDPVVNTNTGVTVERGSSITIGSAALSTSDTEDNAANITYTVTAVPTLGALQLSSSNLSVSDTFTQDDIENSRVRYVHAGGVNTSDSFTFSVADQNAGSVTGQTFYITIQDTTAPVITAVSIPDSTHKVGDTVTTTITVSSDADTYTLGTSTVAGYTLGSLSKTNDTTYTATFTISDGGTDVAAGSSVPVSVVLSDSSSNSTSAFTTAISQTGDAIYANIPDITLSADTTTIAEDGGVATITASLTNSLNNQWPEDIGFTLTFSGTATNTTDYTRSATSLTISAGNSSNTITVTGVADTLFDALSDETVIVNFDCIQTGTATLLSGQQQTITITDAESAPTVTLSVDNASIAENGGTATPTVTLSNATFENVTATLAYSGTATNGTDYNSSASTTITVSQGSASASASSIITSVDDNTSEGDETIIVDVTNVSGGGASEATEQQVTVTITDDDNTAPVLAGLVSTATITEDEASNLSLSDVTLTDDQGDSLTVTFEVSSGTLSSPLGSSGGVVVSGADTTTLILAGSVDDLNTFLDNANAIAVTTASNSTSDITLTVKANDGSIDGNTQTSTLSVTAVNDAPVITSTAVTTATEDSLYSYTLTAEDVDNDSVSWAVKTGDILPGWLTLESVTEHSVSTVAGTGSVGSDDGTGTNASFNTPRRVAVDNNGNLYVTDEQSHVIRKITSAGVVTTFAGSGISGSDDGSGTDASFSSPNGITVDTSGNVYVVDVGNNAIRKITPAGVVSTLAGSGAPGSSNGSGVNASFNSPRGIAADSDSNLYVAEDGNHLIRKITPAGVVSTLAGSGSPGNADGTGTAASFTNPRGVSVDTDGNVYVADTFNHSIRKITPAGVVTTIAGSGTQGSADGTGSNASFYQPHDLTASNDGNLYVLDTVNHSIRKVDANGEVTTIAGSGSSGSADGVGANASFDIPVGITSDVSGNLYVADTFNHLIRKVSAPGYKLSGTPVNDDVGDHDICLVASDGAATAEQCFTITVNNVNDTPTIGTNTGLTVAEGGTGVITTNLLNDSDPDDSGTGLTFTVTTAVNNGTLFLDADDDDTADSGETLSVNSTFTQQDLVDGNIQYAHNGGETTSDSFVFSLADGGEDGVSELTGQTFSITVTSVNETPVITSSQVTSATEDSVYTYTLAATDVDTGDSLAFAAPTLPAWLSFTASTGVLSGTPTNDDVGNHSVVLTATDTGSLTATQNFTITVANTNDAPVITSTAVTAINEDSAYSYTLTASDVDAGDSLTLAATTLPSWLSFNASTGVLSGTPTNDEVGDHAVVLTATDTSSASDTQSFTITVANTNDAPVITSTAVTSATEDSVYSYTLTAADDDGDTITFAATTLPSWLSFNASTGVLSGTPTNDEVGSHNVVLTATDSNSASDTQSFTITVANTNDAPVITSTAVTSVNEDSAYSYTFTASDVDVGDSLTLAATTLPSWLSLNASTGVLSGTPTNDEVGDHAVVLSVTDSSSASDTQSFTITVANTNDAPVITSTAITSATEDSLYSYTLTATDDDGDTITFAATTLPSWLSFNVSTGVLSGTPTNDEVGGHNVVLTATDSNSASDTQSFTITVANTNDAPVITSTAVTSVNEDSLYSYTFAASDVDAGDTLTFAATTLPTWLSFDASTGVLSGTPTNDDVGDHAAVLSVSDTSSATDSQSFTITVTNVNDAPVITSSGSLTIDEDQSTEVTITATDVDSTGLTWSLTSEPALGTANISGSGTSATLSYNPSQNVSGTDSFTIAVSDGSLTATQTFTVTINAINDRPSISGTPRSTIAEGSRYSFTPNATDNDGDTLTFSAQNLPGWLTLNTASGNIAGSPGDEDVGTYDNIILSVTDGTATTSLSAFSITVTNVNEAPVINGTPSALAEVGTAYSFTPTASDPDGDTLTFSVENLPAWLSLDTATGTISGTPSDGDVTTFENIILTVSDGELTASLSAFAIEVIDPNINVAPVVADVDAGTDEDTAASITLQGTDFNEDSLSYSVVAGPTSGSVTITDDVATYTPDADFNGTDSFTYQASDGLLESEAATVTITINAVNDAPVITGEPATQVSFGSEYSFIPEASDVDSETLTFSVENLPEWAAFDASTGALSGTPEEADLGSYADIIISVSDGSLSASLDAFSIEVLDPNANTAPVATGSEVETNEDTIVSFTLQGSDEDGDNLTYTVTTEPASGLFVQDGSDITYRPNDNVSDIQDSLGFTVSDGVDTSDEAFVTINIIAVNDAPVIEGTPQTSVRVGVTYAFTPEAFDVEEDTLTFTIANQPRWAEFDGNTGALTGMPGTTDVGTYGNITISVSDGTDTAALDSFNIDVLENQAPVINGTSVSAVEPGQSYSFTPDASDPEGDTLGFSIENQPAWTSFDTSTGALSGTPQDADVGTYTGIIISVSDGFDTVSLPAFDLEVCTVCGNVGPIISGIAASSVTEGDAYSFIPVASDPNDDALSFTISNQPAWANFDTATGTLSGTPGFADIGITTDIVISVTDGEFTASLAPFSITVVELNEAPVISGTPDSSVFQNAEYRFTPTATDADGDNLTFSIENRPAWAAFNPRTGTLRGTPVAVDVGSYAGIIISVSDGQSSNALEAFSIDVLARNNAPVISGSPRTAITQGVSYSFTPSATDADGDSLSFSATGQPGWLSVNPDTGALTGTPSADDIGTTGNIVVSVTDGTDSASLNAFTITVTEANAVPVASDSSVTVDEDSNVAITANASDGDGDSLSFNVLSGPQNGTLADTDEGWTYTPAADFNGSDSFTWQASDGDATSDTATVSITVTSVNDRPVAVADTIVLDQNESGTYILDVLANDTDVDIATNGDSLTLQGVQADFGSTTITGNQVQFNPGVSFIGDVDLVYSVRDSARRSAQARVSLTINGVSGIGQPVLNVPADLTVDADGLFTEVDLGVANATDADGNPLPVALVRGSNSFRPGARNVFWRTEDSFGSTTTDSQLLHVNPLISLGKDRIKREGDTVSMRVILNGDAPVYPLTVNYSVSGTATAGVDHDAQSGSVTFTSGREQLIRFNILNDEIAEADETIIVSLDAGQNLGANNVSTVTISEENIAPEIRLSVNQSGDNRLTVAQDEGDVTIIATVTDANPQDTLVSDWSSASLSNTSSVGNQFVFTPADVAPGIYQVTLFASDNGDPILSNTADVFIEVVDTLTALSDELDTDGDLIPDAEEGYADSDGDGIPDYLDAIDDCNVVPQQAATQDGFLVESEPGVCLRQGSVSALNDSDGLEVITGGEGAGRQVLNRNGESVKLQAISLPEDTEATNIGGIFDFILYDLPEEGQIASVVIPQTRPIPASAVYRKYSTRTEQWTDFVINDTNQIFSARGSRGTCPPPGSARWVAGLTEGHWCVQLQIRDGGVNDDDGLVNGAVSDPGGVAVVLSGNRLPTVQDDTVTMQWNTSVEIDVLANDSDEDGDTLSLESVDASFGVADITASDTILYTPDNGFVGTDVLTYAVSDGNGGTGSAQLTVTINGNRAPGARNDSATTTDDQPVEIDVLANDTDVDGDTMTLQSATVDNGMVTITASNTLLYTPQSGFDGLATITYTVSDTFGATDTATVSVVVEGNQAPQALDDNVSTAFGTAVTIDVLDNDMDVDGDTLTVVSAQTSSGTVVINDNQTLTFTPAGGFSGVATIIYVISDGQQNDTASVRVTVAEEPVEVITVNNKSGGGAMHGLWLLALLMLAWRRRAMIMVSHLKS